MKNFLKSKLVASANSISDEEIILNWKKQGRPLPSPHSYKRKVIRDYGSEYKCDIFIETGTYIGDMVQAQKDFFEEVFSIEIGRKLYRKARRRFRKDINVTLFLGDSAKVLPKVLSEVNKPAVFWLDGHYSGGITVKGDKECPILEELDAILSRSNMQDVVLIDDARCFVGKNSYPSIKELRSYVKGFDNRWKMEIRDDIIRLTK